MFNFYIIINTQKMPLKEVVKIKNIVNTNIMMMMMIMPLLATYFPKEVNS